MNSQTPLSNETVSLELAEGIVKSMENAISVLQMATDNSTEQVYINSRVEKEKFPCAQEEAKPSVNREEEEMVRSSVKHAAELIRYAQGLHAEEDAILRQGLKVLQSGNNHLEERISLLQPSFSAANRSMGTLALAQPHDQNLGSWSQPLEIFPSLKKKPSTPNKAVALVETNNGMVGGQRISDEGRSPLDLLQQQCGRLTELNEQLQAEMKNLDKNFLCYQSFVSK
jgi:hypothetical protein